MAEYEASRGMPAEAEIVFDVAADVERMERWLPTTVAVRSAGPDVVRVAGDSDGRHYEAEGLFRAEKDQLRLEWGSRDTGDYAGWLQIYHGAAGSSEANLHLSFFAHQKQAHPGAEADALRAEMDEALRRLAEEVTRRVDGGG